MLKEARRKWLEKKMDPFLDYFNYTLPCEDTCPLKYSNARSCQLSFDNQKLFVRFDVPVIDNT